MKIYCDPCRVILDCDSTKKNCFDECDKACFDLFWHVQVPTQNIWMMFQAQEFNSAQLPEVSKTMVGTVVDNQF